jgi:pSer/pThr/pTyr-binding forkhead associated (FHA) protein/type II secretory pathway predicted ATPase ExeA
MPTLVGQSSINTVILPNPEASNVHCLLAPNPDGQSYSLIDAWTELGTCVAGERVTRRSVQPGESFAVGEWTLTIEDGEGPLDSQSTIMPPRTVPYRLVFADEGAVAWPISTASTTTLGRSPFNDIPIADGFASEYHALLALDSRTADQLPLLVDLHSSNGTFVNGRAVHRTHVAPGDVIAIGGCEMELRELEVKPPTRKLGKPHVRLFTPADKAILMPRSILPTLAELLKRKRAAVLQMLRARRAARSAILKRNLRHALIRSDMDPFADEPDPDFFYPSRRHGEAFDALVAWLQNGRPVAGIDGPPGSGKSMLLACLSRHLTYRRPRPVIVQPVAGTLRLDALVEATLARAAEIHGDLSVSGRTALIRWHAAIAELRRRSVLVAFLLDDIAPGASDLIADLVELLDSRPALAATRILLAGPPELRDAIAESPLAERLGVWCHIHGLPLADVPRYISHRVRVATGLRAHVFTRHAVQDIAEHTNRLPAAINEIAGAALALAADHSLPQVSHESVATVIDLAGTDTRIEPAGNEFA